MIDLVDLSRRFRDLTNAELDEPELLASLGDGGFPRADGWPEVLRHRRVILLAEVGPGKTREMREQAARRAGRARGGVWPSALTADARARARRRQGAGGVAQPLGSRLTALLFGGAGPRRRAACAPGPATRI